MFDVLTEKSELLVIIHPEGGLVNSVYVRGIRKFQLLHYHVSQWEFEFLACNLHYCSYPINYLIETYVYISGLIQIMWPDLNFH